MQTGTKISGAAHLVLVGWAVFGGDFTAEPLPFEVQDVSIISAEQFAALRADTQPPEVAETPVALPRPDPDTATPEVGTEPDPRPGQVGPQTAAQPVPESAPRTLPDQPAPEVGATADAAPQPAQPEVVFEPPPVSLRPEPRPIDRVAPVPVAAPPPDTAPDEVETPPVSADEGAETPREPARAGAPEEAADAIVTEAEKIDSAAPVSSPRPPARPVQKAVVVGAPPASEAEPTPPEPSTRAGIDDALAQALGDSAAAAAPRVPTGPPLTGGEKDALRVAVSSCWNVGSLSSAALRTTVVVGVSMRRDGKPESGTIRLLSSSGGPDSAARQAYEAARRAIIRCGVKGYELPADKYGQWRDIEMTFNPERMRIK